MSRSQGGFLVYAINLGRLGGSGEGVSHRHTARASSHRPGVEHRRRMLHKLLMFFERVSSILLRLSLGGKRKGGGGLNQLDRADPVTPPIFGSWVHGGAERKFGPGSTRSTGVIEHVGSAQGTALLWWGRKKQLGFVNAWAEGVPRAAAAAVELVPREWAVGRRRDDHQEIQPPVMAQFRTGAGFDEMFLQSVLSRGCEKDLKNFPEESVDSEGSVERPKATSD